MLWYMAVNNAMLDHLTKQIKESDKSGIWRWVMRKYLWCQFKLRYSDSYLIGFKNLIRSIENIGVSAVYGINYFGRGHLSTDAYVNYIKYDTLGRDLLNSTLNYVPYLKDEYKNMTNFREYGSIKNRFVFLVDVASQFNFISRSSRSKTIMHNKRINANIANAIDYYGSMTHYIERLRNLHSSLRRRIKYVDRLFKFSLKNFSI